MASKTVSFRFPHDLLRAVEAEAKATGQSKTDIIIAACRHWVSLPDTERRRNEYPDILARVEAIEAWIAQEKESRMQSAPEELPDWLQPLAEGEFEGR